VGIATDAKHHGRVKKSRVGGTQEASTARRGKKGKIALVRKKTIRDTSKEGKKFLTDLEKKKSKKKEKISDQNP